MSFGRKPAIPHGPNDLKCPLWKKPMSEVCHECPWWKKLRGKNPQSEEEIDSWHCAVEILPLLQLETAQQVRQTGAATEELRNIVASRTPKNDYPERFIKQPKVSQITSSKPSIEHNVE